ncbi:MAG: hypothetical protein M3N11_03560 [Actinomycetota bacterium]|nr:hypothetical protein [Actinomycetota bacterium]
MRQVKATTTQRVRRALSAPVPAYVALGHPWLASNVPGFAMHRTAMHANRICRPPEAPT